MDNRSSNNKPQADPAASIANGEATQVRQAVPATVRQANNSACPQPSSSGEQAGPDFFQDWQEVDIRPKKRATGGKPRSAGPVKSSTSNPPPPVQCRGRVAKKTKKNKNQRRAARLARELQLATTRNPATREGAQASQRHAPKPAPNLQAAAGGPPPKGKGSTITPQARTSASTPESPAPGPPKRQPGKLPAAKRTRDEPFSPQGNNKKQRLVSPSQPGVSYAQAAASDLTIVITDAKSGKISADQSNAILRGLHQAIVEEARKNIVGATPPKFKGKPVFAEGQLRVFAEDENSAAWSQRCVKALTLPNISLTAIRQSEMARRVKCGLLIPNINNSSWEDVRQAADGLKYQNEWAKVGTWSIIEILRQDQGWFVAFTISEDLVPAFMERGRSLNCGVGNVYLRFRGPGGKYVDQPPTLRVTGAQVPNQQAAGTPGQCTSISGEKVAPPSISKPSIPEVSCEGEDLSAWIESGSADMLEEEEMQNGAPTTDNTDTN
ncbi:uncharacterized protein LOC133531196 [Cydia pomonella]|uniref:uncharacterized protein LOC133531196 n=1 Tax=Cydia pomonella TaxID=82600 RepID=UPI002ADE5752|nr:uncharacterized protein LOC133531196 [Cydia pomonella]XP_061725316.1 uncharacterized protein LOC133531196 [Cydia pomonella]XP_061725317.1 uncharacterized protein LOC133531196 [Cydia pomonella]XP_061725318.1 uncharacterized protein LOC133531196 [Cydia pomonella]XP_061725319.1 uncharacterized protein LOC133531196 [Cydia pomonella]